MGIAPEYQFAGLAAIVIAGFVVLGWIVLRLNARMKRMAGGMEPSGDGTTDLLRRVMLMEARIEEMKPRLHATETQMRTSLRKVGFLRFNPFQDTGGDNSFSVVLLDEQNDGILLSSLYMREGTRLYGKEIVKGTARQSLSEEEARVLEHAMHERTHTA